MSLIIAEIFFPSMAGLGPDSGLGWVLGSGLGSDLSSGLGSSLGLGSFLFLHHNSMLANEQILCYCPYAASIEPVGSGSAAIAPFSIVKLFFTWVGWYLANLGIRSRQKSTNGNSNRTHALLAMRQSAQLLCRHNCLLKNCHFKIMKFPSYDLFCVHWLGGHGWHNGEDRTRLIVMSSNPGIRYFIFTL